MRINEQELEDILCPAVETFIISGKTGNILEIHSNEQNTVTQYRNTLDNNPIIA